MTPEGCSPEGHYGLTSQFPPPQNFFFLKILYYLFTLDYYQEYYYLVPSKTQLQVVLTISYWLLAWI
jgi:hypothetical protein